MFLFTFFKSFFKQLYWLLPFIFFFFGYQSLNLIFYNSHIKTPAVIGMPLIAALEKLSSLNLNTRIISIKEDLHLPEGTVLNQTPSATSFVRSQQTIFLTIAAHRDSKKNKIQEEFLANTFLKELKNPYDAFILVPSFEGKTAHEVKIALEKKGLPYCFFPTIENCDQKIIVAQKPLSGSFIDKDNPPVIQLKLNN